MRCVIRWKTAAAAWVSGVTLVILCSCGSNSSGESEREKKAGSDRFNSIRLTSDNGFIAAGSFDSGGASTNTWAVKLTSARSISWQNAYGGPGATVTTTSATIFQQAP